MTGPTLATSTAVHEDGNVAVTVIGELDMLSAPDLVAALRTAIVTHRPQRLELDLSGVPFMDSTGIQVLVAANSDLGATGGTVRVTGVSREVHRVLRLTGLLNTFGLPETYPH